MGIIQGDNIKTKIITPFLIIAVLLSSISYARSISVNSPDQGLIIPADSLLIFSPAQNSTNADDSSSVRIRCKTGTFENIISINDFKIYGSINGIYSGEITSAAASDEIVIVPTESFLPGEIVTVTCKIHLITSVNDTINPFSWSFIISPGAGSGKFIENTSTPIIDVNISPVIVDINNDRISDLVYASSSYGRIVIKKNSAEGVFTDSYIQFNNVYPNNFDVIDLDNDGYKDIVAFNSLNSPVVICKQDSDGTFTQKYLTVNYNPGHFKIRDIDNDGLNDLMIYGSSDTNAVYMYKNKGDMEFELKGKIPYTNLICSDFEFSDFDNDGDLEFVWADRFQRKIIVAEKLSDFQYSDTTVIILYGEPEKLVCADLNNDGFTDIAASCGYNDAVQIIKNNGAFYFTPASIFYTYYSGILTWGDYNNDGFIDFAAPASKSFYVIKNNGDFTFSTSTVTSPDYIYGIGSGDIDQDGDIDIISKKGNGAVVIFANRNTTPDLKLITPSFDFDNVKPGNSKSTILKIYNAGAVQNLDITNIQSPGDNFIVYPVSGSVSPGDTFKVSVQFKPLESGAYYDSIMIVSNDSTHPLLPFVVKGYGSQVLNVSPPENSSQQQDSINIKIKFALPLDPISVNSSSIFVDGTNSGRHICEFNYDIADSTLSITPLIDFQKCEEVQITLTAGIKTESGDSLTPYIWKFNVTPSQSSGIFRLRKSFAIPQSSYLIESKDFDGDGNPDLVIISEGVGKAIFYLNDGNWNFNPSISLQAGVGPRGMLTGDYDNDGDFDLVISNINSTLLFYQNNGGMNFIQKPLANVKGYIEFISQGDYDGDGDIDFTAASSSSNNQYDIIINEGNFNFNIYDSVSVSYNIGLRSGDLDNDGDIDINLAGIILLNKGNLKFKSLGKLINQKSFQLFDPDKDGDLDFLHTSTISRNDSGLVLSNLVPFGSNSYIPGVLSADFDGDSWDDICAATHDSIIIYKNMQMMNFSKVSGDSISYTISGLNSSDLDQDGDYDLVFISSNNGLVTLYENKSPFPEITLYEHSYRFGIVKPDSSKEYSFYIYSTGALPLSIDSCIVSNKVFSVEPFPSIVQPGDSLEIKVIFKPDDILRYKDTLFIYSNDENGGVKKIILSGRAEQQLIAQHTPGSNAVSDTNTITVLFSEGIEPESLNKNTVRVFGSESGLINCSYILNDDLRLSINPDKKFITGEQVTIVITDKIKFKSLKPVLAGYCWSFTAGVTGGTATFNKMNNIAVGTFPQYLGSADLNNDGISDLIVANSGTDSISLIISERNKGLGSSQNINIGSFPKHIICQDFNEDGKIDIAVNCSNSIVFLENRENLSFVQHVLTLFSGINCIAAADYDGDGDIDIAAYSYYYQKIELWINQGNFEFVKQSLPYEIIHMEQMVSADIDNDGDQDIITCGVSTHNFMFLINDEQLEFSAFYPPDVASYVSSMAIADFDSDNRIDIAASNSNINSASILHNDGNLSFHNIQQPGIKYWPGDLTSGDFDADGDIDLATVNINSYTGSVYLNDSLLFNNIFQFPAKSGLRKISSGDFNGDGSFDIAFVISDESSIGWLMNAVDKNFTLSSYHHTFDTIMVGDTSSTNVTVHSVGIDTVKIDSVYFVNKFFSSNTGSLTIAPGDSVLISIFFKPDSAFTYTDTLIICSNTTSFNRVVIEGTASPLTSITEENNLPVEYELYQNYPNPFNPSSNIKYAVPVESRVKIIIYNLLGEIVEELVNDTKQAGFYTIEFNALSLASGMYIYSLTAHSIDGNSEYSSSKKMLLIK